MGRRAEGKQKKRKGTPSLDRKRGCCIPSPDPAAYGALATGKAHCKRMKNRNIEKWVNW
jgi:hypothetical protein